MVYTGLIQLPANVYEKSWVQFPFAGVLDMSTPSLLGHFAKLEDTLQ